jgi:hypothetical protein
LRHCWETFARRRRETFADHLQRALESGEHVSLGLRALEKSTDWREDDTSLQ